MATQHAAFLSTVSEFNSRFNALRLGARVEPLHHSFWTNEEIRSAKQIQADWDVPEGLTPFYGDWHDLFCLDETAGTVVYLNDAREVLFTWPSCEKFKAALTSVAEEPIRKPRIVKGKTWLDF